MARMHPEDIESLEGPTEGERKVFRFLREAARPDSDFIGWYEPAIGEEGREPDFVLFGKQQGLLVLEVKDWLIDQIEEADPRTFKIWIAGQEEPRTNPDRQAKGYVNDLMDALKDIPEFQSGPGNHEGRLKIPIGRMVVFTNISRDEYLEHELNQVIPPERILFREDLAAEGEIRCDPSGKKFQDRIAQAFPFTFHGFSGKEIYHLNSILYPVIKFGLPQRQGTCKLRFQREVQALDEDQAQIALSLKAGHQLIKGPPGSGKTLVLVHRCCFLQKYHPKIKRILLVCYNIALVSYLKRFLQEKGVGVGEDGVQVLHFYDLCRKILGMEVEFDNPEPGYYETIIQLTREALDKNHSEGGLYDALLVDEGQDFTDDMLKILLRVLRPEGDLVIALDAFQDLYRREGSWKSIGIEAQGGSRTLRQVYRSTAELHRFAQCFIGEEEQPDSQMGLFAEDPSCIGPTPEIIRFPNSEAIEEFLIHDIQAMLRKEEYRRSEIGIIYDDKVYGPESFKYQDKEIPRQVLKNLEMAGIPTKWVSEDVRAKELFDITTDRVALISIHSAKGLDFDLVYLLGLDRIIPDDDTRDRLTRLLYVAITRAKYRLVIPYVEETEFITRFKNCIHCYGVGPR